tara:strand:- start:440 stop:631 length:192 start_codon:yes stop_codon:yes gene_type:complete
MQNNEEILPIVGLFHTPNNWDELNDYIEKSFHGAERAAVFVSVYMAWNLAAKLANERGVSDER